MITHVFKPFSQWVLTALLAIAPSLAIEAHLDKSLAPSLEASKRSHPHYNQQELEQQITGALEQITIFLHDYAFAILGGLPSEFAINDDLRARQNAHTLALLTSSDPATQAQAEALLNLYITAGENYANVVLANLLEPTNPAIESALQEWLVVSNQLAAALHLLNPKVISSKEARRLLTTYTLELAAMINRLAPTVLNNPNYTESSHFYTEARTLIAQELGPLVSKAVSKSKKHRPLDIL